MSNPDFALAESVSTTNAYYFICIYILVLIYCCFGLAIVCDAYFVPALQKLSYSEYQPPKMCSKQVNQPINQSELPPRRIQLTSSNTFNIHQHTHTAYDLSPDIAGSTLMALGASVPELFASLIGVFVTEDDIGTGSIIGSSCFNLIAVPAACAFVASATFSRKLIISPVPVMRNSAFYAITILVLLLIIKDNKVDIPEAVILLLFFVMYMAFMIICAHNGAASEGYNQQSQENALVNNSVVSNDSAIAECGGKVCANKQHSLLGNGFKAAVTKQEAAIQQQVYGHYYFTNTTAQSDGFLNNNYLDERTPLVNTNKSCEVARYSDEDSYHAAGAIKNEYLFVSEPNLLDSVSVDLAIAIKNSSCLIKRVDDTKHDDTFGHDENSWLNSYWVLLPMFPLTLSMKMLSPLKFKNSFWTIWTFIVSICLIGALTYVSVWMVHLFGQLMGIPETVAGMTILSWGTGIPELIASIVLIKKTAQADMAICNTIGSNVIDASFCLSVPWMVKCMMNKAAGLKPEVEIQSAALPWTSFTLFLSVVLLILILKLHNWELSCSVGVWLTITYAMFVAVATYLESSFSESGLDLLSII